MTIRAGGSAALLGTAVVVLAFASAASGAPPGPAPPGGVLAFGCVACAKTNTRELLTVRTDGTALTVLRRSCGERESGGPDFPAWSPDGTRLAYSCDFHAGGAIWTSRADGSDARPLTQRARRAEEFEPAWSPDGRRLAWERRRFDSQTWRLVVARADGRGERLLGTGLSPSWSRRGRLVFETGNGLATAAADGSDRRLLGPRRSHRSTPRWSPDGRRIAFVDAQAGGTAIRVLDLADYGVRTLALTDVDPTSDIVSIGWSPDAQWLAYGIETTVPSGEPGFSFVGVELWAMRVVDGARTLVYSDTANEIRGVSWTRS